jgi:hypothetical protein
LGNIASEAKSRVLAGCAQWRRRPEPVAVILLVNYEKEKSPTADPLALEHVAQSAMSAGD